ncbi:MAG: outer membrane lipoprotein carrier protein LolA [Polyangiaceae bacterium]
MSRPNFLTFPRLPRSPRVMLRGLVVALAWAAVVQAPGTSRADGATTTAALPAVDDAVAKVQAFYDRTTSFQSEFQQEFWVKAYNQKKTSRGKVTFAKPGKMVWSYEEPKDNRVVSDGALLRVFESANKQMYEQPVDESQYPAALSFLTGQGKLSDSFKFQLLAGDSMNFKGGYVLVGTPATPTSAYQRVLFYVDKESSQVRRVLILDGQGNRNRFDFTTPRVNEPVKPELFQFTPPPGTTVIRPNAGGARTTTTPAPKPTGP